MKRADVPFVVDLATANGVGGKAALKVLGPVASRAALDDSASTAALRPRGEIEGKAFDLWLLQLAKQKLLTLASRLPAVRQSFPIS